MAGKTEFKYSASAELIGQGKSLERVDVSNGRGALKNLQDGERYQVQLVIDARFSGPFGPDHDGAAYLKGHPFGKKFEVTWVVDTVDGKPKIVGRPKKQESNGMLMPADKCDLNASEQGDSVVATVTCVMYQLMADVIKDSHVFVCDLAVQKRPEIAAPKVPRDLTKVSAYFGEPGRKGLNSANLPTSSLKDLDKWVREIEKLEDLYQVIGEGMVPLTLEGNTSKSGSKTYNAKLAKQRIEAVERKLQSSFGSSKVTFDSKPKAQSKFEEEHDYRVDVSFVKEVAEIAMINRSLTRAITR